MDDVSLPAAGQGSPYENDIALLRGAGCRCALIWSESVAHAIPVTVCDHGGRGECPRRPAVDNLPSASGD